MTESRQYQFHSCFLKIAEEISKLSYANKAKVGSILVKDNRIVAIGYNGQPSGFDNCCETINSDGSLKTKETVIHAEANVIYFCAKNGIETEGSVLYITLSPCLKCAIAIMQAGITAVYYKNSYHDLSGVEFLKQNDIFIKQL